MQKIKTTMPKKVAAVLLWIVVIFLFAKGVQSVVLSTGQQQRVNDAIKVYKMETDLRAQRSIGMAAVAESFVQEYYSFSDQNSGEYEKRVKQYLNGAVDLSIASGRKTTTEVMKTETLSVNFLAPEKADVDVLAKIKYTAIGSGASTEGAIESLVTEVKDLVLRVPVICSEDQFAVEDIPVMIPFPDKAQAKSSNFVGSEVSTSEKTEITGVLESFLKTYYEGSSNEISYYVTADSKIRKGLQGRIKFSRIEFATIYGTADGGRYIAQVSLIVLDGEQPIKQRYYINLVKSDRYYIEAIETRVEG